MVDEEKPARGELAQDRLPDLGVEVLALADARISIPMTGAVESLNVAVAAALILYEAKRQRALGAPKPCGEGGR